MNPLDSRIGCVDLMVDRHVRSGRGRHTALVELPAPGDSVRPRRSLTYAQLQSVTQDIAAELAEHAHGRALRVAIIGSATLETVCWWLGGMRAGHMVFLVHPDLPAAQYATLFEVYRPDLVLRDRTAGWRDAERLPEVPANLRHPDVVCPPAPLPAPDEGEFIHDLRPALVLASSGSTGRPKLCVHAHRSFWAFERDVSRAMWKLDASDRVLASGGPFFSFGLQGIHPPLSVGATALLLPEWREHRDFLQAIADEGASVFLAVPTLYHLLQSRSDPEQLAASTRTLRVAMSAGERLPAVVRRRWESHTGVALCDSIGTTETFAPYLSEQVDAGPGLRAIAGFDYEMRFTGTAGASGERVFMAVIRGLCLMRGTVADDGSIEPLVGSFATQDLFTLQEAGWQFVSRRSERVKVSGLWVSPQELEEFLLHDERVVKAAAVTMETAEGLQRLRAFVVLRVPIAEREGVAAELLEHARAELRPKALCPDRVCVVEELSATPTGKFKRAEFRQRVHDEDAAQRAIEKEALT